MKDQEADFFAFQRLINSLLFRFILYCSVAGRISMKSCNYTPWQSVMNAQVPLTGSWFVRQSAIGRTLRALARTPPPHLCTTSLSRWCKTLLPFLQLSTYRFTGLSRCATVTRTFHWTTHLIMSRRVNCRRQSKFQSKDAPGSGLRCAASVPRLIESARRSHV